MSQPAPSTVWSKVGTDIMTLNGQDYIDTVFYLSGFFEVNRLPSKRITDVIYALRTPFARHGIPLELVCDNSPFGAAEFINSSLNAGKSHIKDALKANFFLTQFDAYYYLLLVYGFHFLKSNGTYVRFA